MFKHSQTIRWKFTEELSECVWPFCEIGAERVKVLFKVSQSKEFTEQMVQSW